MTQEADRKTVVVLGAGGQLAKALIQTFRQAGHECVAFSHARLDVTRFDDLNRTLDRVGPDILINGSAYNHVDAAQKEPTVCAAVNTDAVEAMARWCAVNGCLFVHFSTDFVFDGKKGSPYTEDDPPKPLNVYGLTKWWGEQKIRESGCRSLIFRLSWVFGDGNNNFLAKLHQWVLSTDVLRIVADEISVPTYTWDAAAAVRDAVEAGLEGLFHLCQRGETSRYEWACEYARLIDWDVAIEPISRHVFNAPAPRPVYSVLSPEKLERALGRRMRPWRQALAEHCVVAASHR